MLFAGIDIGSTTSKCVLIDETQTLRQFHVTDTEVDRNASGEKVLRQTLELLGADRGEIAGIVSTGYGRKAFDAADKAITEIIAHAYGTAAVFPGARTIIDIGGQDSKVIAIDNGLVTKFEMNDKCAAGTGRFFEVLTHRLLGVEMEDLSDLIARADDPCQISSMCTIFAESEIISYLSQGKSKENIVSGVSRAIARRVIAMGKAGRIDYLEPIVFSGGVAKNQSIANIFSELLGKPVTALAAPQSTAAMGAALTAYKEYHKQHAQ